MGQRLEIVLLITIIVTLITATLVTLSDTDVQKENSNKEMEFRDTTFIEVDLDKMLAKAYSSHGIRQNGILILKDLRYQTHTIERLVADKATYHSDILALEGNVSLHQKDGFDYTTDHAMYNQKTEILLVNSPFVGKMDKNIIHGDRMKYDAAKKEAEATQVDAVVYTVKK